jgi:MoaA/NifB/PqqE/SkfB family radical SAM enzyme
MDTKKLKVLLVELTNDCNMVCRHCPRRYMKRKVGYMSVDLFKEIIDISHPLTAEVNFSFFGEPLLHPYFKECMEYVCQFPLKVTLNTNMTLADDGIRALLCELGVDEVRVGIDGSNRRMYGIMRDGRYFRAVEENLWYWLARKHPPTRLVYTVAQINKDDQGAFVDKWRPLLGSRDHILVKSMLSYGGKMQDSEIIEHPCVEIQRKNLVVSWDGRVSPCHLDTDMELVIGKYTDLPELIQNFGIAEEKIRSCPGCQDGGISQIKIIRGN